MQARPARARLDDQPSPESQRWAENRPSGEGRSFDRRELWEYRELVRFLAGRDLKVRYKQAVFGMLWAVVTPFAGALTLAIVFRRVADVSSDGIAYLPFVLLGYSAWTYCSKSVGSAAASLVSNRDLITKVYFPRVLAPIASLLPGLVDLVVALAALAIVMAWVGIGPGLQIITLPLWIAALGLLALGVGLFFATLNVQYRDAGAILPMLTQLWFFISPIGYPASEVPDTWRTVYFLNPVAGAISGVRWSVLDGPWPGHVMWASGATAAVILAASLWYFHSAERRLADVI